MSDRYAETFPGDSGILVDGDDKFIGMNARLQPEKVEPGYVVLSQNMRFTNYTANVRMGMAKQTNGITINGPPLIVPFIVGSGAIVVNTVADGVFGATTFSDPNNNNLQSIIIPCGSEAYQFTASGTLSTISYPGNELVETTDTVDYWQYGNQVYLVRGDTGTSFAVSSLSSSGTLATFQAGATTNLSSNMWVKIAGAVPAAYNGNWQITVASASSFTFTLAGATTSPASGSITCNRLKLPMKWNGVASGSFSLCNFGVIAQNFSYIAPSNFGIIQVNRAIMEQSRNNLIMSQVEAPEVFDTINGVFSFGPGTSDYLVGVCPYQDQFTLVFLRHSVWLLDGVSQDVSAISTQIMTPSVGCISKRTIQTCGANVLFLSDLGVYQFVPGYELALRGNVLPLSADLDGIIGQINFNATNVPCAAYTNNRYYLAVPLNGSTRNNCLLVYNFINKAWESQDTFPTGFYCDYMTVMYNAAGDPTLYVLSYEGGLYAYEQNQQDDFAAASSSATQYLIQGLVTTRRLVFGGNTLKKFNRAIVNYQLDASSAMACRAIITNPDDTRTMPTVSVTAAASVITRPMLINKRGYGLQLQFTNTANRGTVLNYQVGAFQKDLKSVMTT